MFRFNNRATKDNPLNDADRFMLAVSQISGKRLTYAELTGKVAETASNELRKKNGLGRGGRTRDGSALRKALPVRLCSLSASLSPPSTP